jgi:hypothetical protein
VFVLRVSRRCARGSPCVPLPLPRSCVPADPSVFSSQVHALSTLDHRHRPEIWSWTTILTFISTYNLSCACRCAARWQPMPHCGTAACTASHLPCVVACASDARPRESSLSPSCARFSRVRGLIHAYSARYARPCACCRSEGLPRVTRLLRVPEPLRTVAVDNIRNGTAL